MKEFVKLSKEYVWFIIGVSILGVVTNGLALFVPKLGARAIDQFTANLPVHYTGLIVVAAVSFVVAVVQIYLSTYFSEKVALKLRSELIDKISEQTFMYIANSTAGRLLTVVTSDVDAVKGVISMGIVSLLSAGVTLIGSIIFLLVINFKLGLATISIIPFLLVAVVGIFGSMGKLFQAGQETLEKINAVTNESIVGAALVRVLDAAAAEVKKFFDVNSKAREIGFTVVRYISFLIPVITLLANITTIIILWFGGRQVIGGTLSLGEFSAFLAYSALFIWPLFVLSFTGSMISRGAVSLVRVREVLDAEKIEEKGSYKGPIKGAVEFKNVSLSYKDESGTERTVLKDVSFKIQPGTKNAVVGPTAAGKTQLFYLMAGLVLPTAGEIYIDGRLLKDYHTESLLRQVGLVFQDSIVFNTTLRENISLSSKTTEEVMMKALRVAELERLVEELPKGIDSLVSERGTSLSGGQKQRLMLARALAVDPRILLLDDFTARVDRATEASILKNVADEYPNITLVSITQKVEPIKNYEKIIVLMEGELVAEGTHENLLKNSFEYRQIYESQQSTEEIS